MLQGFKTKKDEFGCYYFVAWDDEKKTVCRGYTGSNKHYSARHVKDFPTVSKKVIEEYLNRYVDLGYRKV